MFSRGFVIDDHHHVVMQSGWATLRSWEWLVKKRESILLQHNLSRDALLEGLLRNSRSHSSTSYIVYHVLLQLLLLHLLHLLLLLLHIYIYVYICMFILMCMAVYICIYVYRSLYIYVTMVWLWVEFGIGSSIPESRQPVYSRLNPMIGVVGSKVGDVMYCHVPCCAVQYGTVSVVRPRKYDVA